MTPWTIFPEVPLMLRRIRPGGKLAFHRCLGEHIRISNEAEQVIPQQVDFFICDLLLPGQVFEDGRKIALSVRADDAENLERIINENLGDVVHARGELPVLAFEFVHGNEPFDIARFLHFAHFGDFSQ